MQSPNSPAVHPAYRPDIDGLRGVAVLSVVGYHMLPKVIDGGFIGVDIFFVISGYLISLIILTNLQNNSFSFIDFYSRRVRRIFPALLTVMVASLIGGWFLFAADEYAQLGKHIAGGATYVSNFVLWHESGYFDGSAETKPFLHLWSLAIEEQFYIVWPLLLFFAWKKPRLILPLTGIIAVLSFAINVSLIGYDKTAAFYSPLSRCLELMIGGLLAYMSLHHDRLQKAYPNVQSILGCTLLILGFSFINQSREFPGWWALLPTFGAFFLISAGSHAWINRHLLSRKVILWFGLISYPLYLWHWPILSFVRIISGEIPPRKIRMLSVGASILLAWLTYKFVEKPIRLNTHLHAKATALLLALLAVGSTGYVIYAENGISSRSAVQNYSFNSHVAEQFVGALWQYTQNDICMQQHPFPAAKDYSWFFCMQQKPESPTVILLGNSYANQLYPGLTQNEKFAHQNVLSIGTCGPIEYDAASMTPVTKNPCSGDRPYQQQQLIDTMLAQNPTIKFAILDGLLVKPDNTYIKQLQDRITFLENNHIQVIVFIPHIEFGRDVRSCFSRPLKIATAQCTFNTDLHTAILNDFKPTMDAVSKTHPGVKFFDQNQLFCTHQTCTMIKDGMPLFRDDVHISEYGSIELGKIFMDWAKIHQPNLLKR